MSTNQIEFIWSDAWLLQAIAYAEKNAPATLKDVIAAGDAINHAIFTYAELQTGLAKLLAAGYIRHEGDKFSLSSTFAEEYIRLSGKHRTIHKQLNAVENYLHAKPWREEFDKAIEDYKETHRRGRKKKKG